MCLINSAIVLFLQLVLMVPFFQPGPDSSSDRIYKMGEEKLQAGNPEEALEIWEQANPELLPSDAASSSLTPNPRIGISYIELVADQKLTSFYKKASQMYLWGLQLSNEEPVKRFEEVLEKELLRLEPIVDPKQMKQWESYLGDENYDSLGEEIIKYWKKLDPTVNTSYNERLLEHWQRISFSRKNFTENKKTVYDTDERAEIYIKLGSPDYVKKGDFYFNTGMADSWLFDALGGMPQNFGGGGGFGSSAASSDSVGSSNTSLSSENYLIYKIKRRAQIFHRQNYYEVWIYRNLFNNEYQNLVYLFGEEGDTGLFGLRRSVEDMIPSGAFRKEFGNNSNVTAGLLLQLMYYEQLIIADNYFADIFRDLESRIVSLEGLDSFTSFRTKSISQSRLNNIQYRAPTYVSSTNKRLKQIDLEVSQYRFLDDSDQSYLATFVESSPQKALYLDQINEGRYNNESYMLYHSSVTVDTQNEVVDLQKKNSEINLEGNGFADQMEKSHSYFRIPHISSDFSQVFTVELHNKNKDSLTVSEETLFSETLRGIGKAGYSQPDPLDTARSKLEMSDLLIGYPMGSPGEGEKGPASFKVAHDKVIPGDQDLMVYFEVYHLRETGGQNIPFRINYMVTPKKKGLLGKLFGRQKGVGLTLNIESNESRYNTGLEIDTTPFDPGIYELAFTVSEPGSGRQVKRLVEFEIK